VEHISDSPFDSGEGSETDPFVITTAEQLATLAVLVNEGNTDFNDKYYKLSADIDLSGYANGAGWIPIGNSNNKFKGSFDGGGHKITGLKINAPKSNYLGLFGYVQGANRSDRASIANLNTVDTQITGGFNVGVLAGYVKYAEVAGCFVTGDVNGAFSVGGLAGVIDITDVANCDAAGNVTGSTFVGGLAGSVGNESQLTDCRAAATVVGSDGVGGLAGLLSGSNIINSHFVGTVTGESNLGDIVGYNENGATLTGCTSSAPKTIEPETPAVEIPEPVPQEPVEETPSTEGVAEPPTAPEPEPVPLVLAPKKPKAKLSASSVSMYKIANLRVTGVGLADLYITNSTDFSVTEPDTNGSVQLSYNGEGTVSASKTLKLKASFNGTEKTVPLTLRVKKPGSVKYKFSKSTVTLNKALADAVTVNVTATPVDAEIPAAVYDEDKLDVTQVGNSVLVRLKENTQKGKSYKVKIGKATLTVKAVDKAPIIRLSSKGRLNVLDLESAVTLTPKFTGMNYSGGAVSFENGATENERFFIDSVSPTGAVTIKMKDSPTKTTERQAVVLYYSDESGTTWPTAKINITPKRIKL
jgi:hypothetical protein